MIITAHNLSITTLHGRARPGRSGIRTCSGARGGRRSTRSPLVSCIGKEVQVVDAPTGHQVAALHLAAALEDAG